MMTLIIIIHVTACVILITLVLIQRGRGAGLVESFAGVESMFGTKTNVFLTRTTTIMSVVFFTTCLTLAVLSVRQSKSLMRSAKQPAAVKTEAVKTEAPKVEAAKTEAAKTVVVSTPAVSTAVVPTVAAQTAPLPQETKTPAPGAVK
ncbi:MAG: preprotein translocase subunit SecG [Candidatus Omnitrophota bacterium]|nr:preprotein translocase subunit SecG [Candidatus Omnitrophota bacterium]